MKLLRRTWQWSGFVLAALVTAAVLLAAPLTELLGEPAASPRTWTAAFGAAWAGLTAMGVAASSLRAAQGKELEPLERFSGLLSLLLLVGVFGLLSRALLAFAPRGGETAFAKFLDGAFDPSWRALSSAGGRVGVPTELAGVPTAPVALLGAMLFARQAVEWRIERIRRGSQHAHVWVPGEVGGPDEDSGEALARARAVERRIAIGTYAEAKTLLEESRTELAFLALDVVSSMLLKDGQDPFDIEQSFSDYRALVERALRRHGASKQIWTPDGQMAAFRSPQAAVECAKEVLRALPAFNGDQSRLARPFRVRAGANVGTLFADDRTPIEEISHPAVDVAGHLQKYADPDTLWISEDLYARLTDTSGFTPTAREVDGRRVYVWNADL